MAQRNRSNTRVTRSPGECVSRRLPTSRSSWTAFLAAIGVGAWLAWLGDVTYRPRRAENTVLHCTVRDHLEDFRAELERSGRWLPGFVWRGLERFLECGVLAYGFVRAECEACRRNRFVAFSCKTRGLCPSCGGRRMHETAAHLADSDGPERARVIFRTRGTKNVASPKVGA